VSHDRVVPEEGQPIWFVYMLECVGGQIYTGITPDVAARFERHCRGRGAAYTRINKPLRILAARACGSRSEATKVEIGLKKLSRVGKLEWVRQQPWRPLKDQGRTLVKKMPLR